MAMTPTSPRPAPRVSIVVPTLGRSPLLGDCLEALRAEAVDGCELIVVAQGDCPVPEPRGHGECERWLRAARPLGFAGAVNLGIAAAAAPYVAVMNDDAVVEPGWLAALTAALDADAGAASVQGWNLSGTGPAEPDRREPVRIDGRGLAWNRWLQAVQLDHGEPEDGRPAAGRRHDCEPREVFGVSATAALYRRRTLLAVARPGDPSGGEGAAPEVFDSRLGTYYEDADLALRLRAAGYRALSVGAARVWHGGSLTAGDGVARWRRVHGNRYLVVAEALGRSFWPRLPRMVLRDVLDLAAVLATGRLRRAAGILAGWGRAVRHLPAFAHTGAPRLASAALLAPEPAAGGPVGAP